MTCLSQFEGRLDAWASDCPPSDLWMSMSVREMTLSVHPAWPLPSGHSASDEHPAHYGSEDHLAVCALRDVVL